MMKRIPQRILIFIMTVFCIVLLSSRKCAAFRCGSGLVTTGDTKAKVLIECGEPTYKEKADGKKSGTKAKNKSAKTVDGVTYQTTKRPSARKVERWYYNCGDNDFIYVLEFENNILQREDTTDRGKGKSDCTGKK